MNEEIKLENGSTITVSGPQPEETLRGEEITPKDRRNLPRNTSQLKRVAKKMFGPYARVWQRDGEIHVGLEHNGTKAVFASGVDAAEAWVKLTLAVEEASKDDPTVSKLSPEVALTHLE